MNTVKGGNTPSSSITLSRKSFYQMWLIAILFFLVCISTVWLWKSAQLRHQRRIASLTQQQFAEKTDALLMKGDSIHLVQLSKSLGWLIENDLSRSGLLEDEQDLDRLVQLRGFRRIDIADGQGVVVFSTDKHLLAKPLSAISVFGRPSTDSTFALMTPDSLLQVISPIKLPAGRRGTLQITYKPDLLPLSRSN